MTREAKPTDDRTEQIARILLLEFYQNEVADHVWLRDTKNPKGIHVYQVATVMLDTVGDML